MPRYRASRLLLALHKPTFHHIDDDGEGDEGGGDGGDADGGDYGEDNEDGGYKSVWPC